MSRSMETDLCIELFLKFSYEQKAFECGAMLRQVHYFTNHSTPAPGGGDGGLRARSSLRRHTQHPKRHVYSRKATEHGERRKFIEGRLGGRCNRRGYAPTS